MNFSRFYATVELSGVSLNRDWMTDIIIKDWNKCNADKKNKMKKYDKNDRGVMIDDKKLEEKRNKKCTWWERAGWRRKYNNADADDDDSDGVFMTTH